MDSIKDEWTSALPAVLRLVTGHKRDLFRHELQRFLAFSNMAPADAEAMVGPLRELLLQSARSARQPAAIHATRAMPPGRADLVALAEHILAGWRDAEAAAHAPPPEGDGLSGPIFFGARLGGEVRAGAVSREDLGLDD